MISKSIYNLDAQLYPKRVHGPGNCSECVFRNYGDICQQMICQDPETMTFVSWHVRQGGQFDAMCAFCNAVQNGVNISELCHHKMAELAKSGQR